MTKHTIILPEPVTAYIDGQLADGRYASLSAYVSELVVRDMALKENAKDELRVFLDDAEQSGVTARSLEEILEYAKSPARRSTREL